MTSLEPKYTEPWVKPVGIVVIVIGVYGLFTWVVLTYIDNQLDVCPQTKEYTTLKRCKETE